jgi:hypothetical protein
MLRMTRIGGSLASGGFPSANSISVMPKDQMSADASYLQQICMQGSSVKGIPWNAS